LHACRPSVEVQSFPALIHGMQHRGKVCSMMVALFGGGGSELT
jgi:hypothetical protein